MTPKTTLLLTCGSAVIGMLLIHLHLSHLESQTEGGEKVSVLVALDDIPAGTPLSKEQLVIRQVPMAYLNPRQIEATDTNRVLGIRLNTALKSNDYLQWTDLSQGQAGGRDLASLIQGGMRALSLKGDNLFDGLLRPGDRVDVLFTTHEGAEPSTATLLQNIMVLSVGGIIDRANSTSSRGLASSAVLSVSLEQSQLLTQALEHGTLALVLRNPDDILIAKNTPTANAHDVLPTAGSAKSQTSIKAAESKPAEVVRAR